MRKLITSSITGSIGAPFDKPSVDNVQSNFSEIPDALVKGLIGSYTTNDLIVLYGFVITLSNSNNTATWTAGAIYYNGEIYQVAAGTDTKTGGQTFVYSIVDTITTTQFDDGNTYNWLENKTIKISHGTSGTGIADYNSTTVYKLLDWINGNNSALPFAPVSPQNIGLQNSYTATGGAFSTPRFAIDVYGNFRAIGSVTIPTPVTSSVFGILPVGSRPNGSASFAVFTANISGKQYNVTVNGATGEMIIQTSDGTALDTGSGFSLENIKYNIYD